MPSIFKPSSSTSILLMIFAKAKFLDTNFLDNINEMISSPKNGIDKANADLAKSESGAGSSSIIGSSIGGYNSAFEEFLSSTNGVQGKGVVE